MNTQRPSNDPRSAWLTGISRALPIVMGYIPIGIAFGVLAHNAGISWLNTVLMSLLVFAGSSQLIAVGLIEAEQPPLTIILITLVVNLRHLLMSAALAPYLKKWRKAEIAAFTFELTDETFALHAAQFAAAPPDKVASFASNLTAQTAWVVGSALGAALGNIIHNTSALGLDYALPAMFIALLILQITERRHVIVAILTGTLSVILLSIGFDHWSVIAATLVGATIGLGLELWMKKPSA